MASITLRLVKGSALTNAEVDANFDNINTELGQKVAQSLVGVANGVASLDASGLVPSTQLPSYVDDVLEYADLAAFPATGAMGKIYVAIDTGKTYRWSGSVYVEISASPGSTDAVTEGSTNLYFTNARARGAISVTGSLSYNSSTGVISYTQPTNVSTFTNDAGYLTGITSGQVTTALGYTPYNSSNPSNYIDQAGARSAISVTQNLTYNSTTGVITGPDLSGYLLSATAASTYQTQAGMSAYLTTASASSTYLTQASAASTYQTQSGMSSYLTTASAASTYLTQANAASTYQPTLVSGTNIKTINGASIVGSGNVTISGSANGKAAFFSGFR